MFDPRVDEGYYVEDASTAPVARNPEHGSAATKQEQLIRWRKADLIGQGSYGKVRSSITLLFLMLLSLELGGVES